ncbi:MAG TPA: hypothetical protein PKA00_03645 [Saprospiraceae bacterium]|nr:hypothetical protein [Saprospiraceae bacterium]HMQ81971.1 hypothetical protein [Saprospiraceae bacterium]
MIEAYDIQKHIHHYAVWTAARASQRGFTKTEHIQAAIDATDLSALAMGELSEIKESKDFDHYHKKVCASLKAYFSENNLPFCSYGRVAKIVAIYLKTAVVLPTHGKGPLAAMIHPPIDSILLKNLHRQPAYKQYKLNQYRWTALQEQEYWALWEILKSIQKPPYWQLERYWTSGYCSFVSSPT